MQVSFDDNSKHVFCVEWKNKRITVRLAMDNVLNSVPNPSTTYSIKDTKKSKSSALQINVTRDCSAPET